jgi:hypothetical protein
VTAAYPYEFVEEETGGGVVNEIPAKTRKEDSAESRMGVFSGSATMSCMYLSKRTSGSISVEKETSTMDNSEGGDSTRVFGGGVCPVMTVVGVMP